MISKNRFYIFVVLGIVLIINTQLLYPLQVSLGLLELSWITIGTLAAIFGYYVALKSNYAPFQTFVMRLIFWGFVFTLFLSIIRRTFEFLGTGIVYLGLLNTLLYFLIVLLITLEGRSLYYSYGRGKVLKNSNTYDDSIKKIEPQKLSNSPAIKIIPKKEKKVSKRIDNLTLIEGIGPVIEKVLSENGITTFKQISQTPAYKLKEILDANNLQQHSPKTWPKQAELAHNNKWDELRKWQDELLGGREN
ncbi:MAG: hypothetical protein LAT82_03805 [Nanoarchaeota archaeon]|nr:hypothetical protein [Nanoarchaeota archaeon]